MEYEVFYKELPKSHLLNTLYKKSSELYHVDFDFFGVLNRIRQRVSAEVAQINRLFPEYTPHDEAYHLKRLFSVADSVLGHKLIESMKATELFILSCGLYCHDWGMAVSESEKNHIRTLNETKTIDISNDFWILDNEREHFKEFLQQQGVKQSNNTTEALSEEIWRIYIRQTHALRSGVRALKFFEEHDQSMAKAISEVCIGHWLDFKNIRKYPSNYSVLGESINLRALAIYVRLIDLLDITSYRTPYVIWKFVLPQNPFSKMEWDKHRAIHSLSIKDYSQGRVIQVDGGTEDHEVYAALEDLKAWCDEQFRGCNDLLAEMNDKRHILDIYHIDWRIEPIGFKPSKVRFEFDREKMFEILAEEIYQNDPYVFLRELLQNSIDAIRLRKAYLKDKGLEIMGVINVEVEHLEDGDAIITWTDNGIGMNEHIIRNYLAVAGRSYYGSDEFKNEGLNIDPISRFGVGILSCFSVSECIEFETRREPYVEMSDMVLRVRIPSVKNHFRIDNCKCTTGFVGTRVKVYVNGRKIAKSIEANTIVRLEVTKYLSLIAGFVEFPIVIDEGDTKTAVLHPKYDERIVRERFGEQYRIHKLSFEYPWDEMFLPQDLAQSKEIFVEKNVDISSILPERGYEGNITHIVPKYEYIDLRIGDFNYKHDGIETICKGGCKKEDAKKARVYKTVRRNRGICKSCKIYSFHSVYRDGILISEAISPREFMKNRGNSLPNRLLPRIVVNLPKNESKTIDLARMHILGKYERWDRIIKKNYVKSVIDEFRAELISKDVYNRLYIMGRLLAYYNISIDELWSNFDTELWPVLYVNSEGEVICLEWKEVKQSEIYITPEYFDVNVENAIYNSLYTENAGNPIIKDWIGESGFIAYSPSFKRSHTMEWMIRISSYPIKQLYQLSSIRFLSSPLFEGIPIVQQISEKSQAHSDELDQEEIYIRAMNNPLDLSKEEKARLFNNLSYNYNIPKIIEFKQPYDKCFAYGWEMINYNHLIGQVFVKLIAFIELERSRKSLTPQLFGCLRDCLSGIPDYDYNNLSEVIDAIRQLWLFIKEYRLFNIGEVDDLIPNKKDFVPGTVIVKDNNQYLFHSLMFKNTKRLDSEFVES